MSRFLFLNTNTEWQITRPALDIEPGVLYSRHCPLSEAEGDISIECILRRSHNRRWRKPKPT